MTSSLSQRRSINNETMLSSSCTSTPSNQTTKAPIELIFPATELDHCDNADITISRSSRVGLGINFITLLLISLIGQGLKSLSNSITNLTEIIHSLEEGEEKNIQKLRTLERELAEKEIELWWEKQHIVDNIQVNDVNEKELFGTGLRNYQFKLELNKQKEENTNLKKSLDSAMKVLSQSDAGYAHPMKPGNLRGGLDEEVHTDSRRAL